MGVTAARRRLAALMTGAALLAGAACRPAEPMADQKDFAMQLDRWERSLQRKLGHGILQLRGRSCLYLSRIAKPWKVEADFDRGYGDRIVAPGAAVSLPPTARDLIEGPSNGIVRVEVGGWAYSAKDWDRWTLAPPERIRFLIAHEWKRSDLWMGRSARLEAYGDPGGERAYVDPRRLTQCRDYGDDFQILCVVVAQREDFSFGMKLSPAVIPTLPESLDRLERAIEATRASCPRGTPPLPGEPREAVAATPPTS